MKHRNTNRSNGLLTTALALVVLLAGCTSFGGLGGGGEATTAAAGAAESADGTNTGGTSTGGGENTASESEDTDSGTSGSGALDEAEEWFNLSEPGRWVFEIETTEDGNGRMVIETTDVANGQATTSVLVDVGEESTQQTVTAPVGEVETQLVGSSAFGYITAIRLGGIGATSAFGDDIAVGQRFEQTTAEGSILIEVTGTDSYAGVDCYVIETRVNDTLSQEYCTRGAYDASPFVAIYDENGDLVDRIELVEHERG